MPDTQGKRRERSERQRSDDRHTQSKRPVEEDDLIALEDLTRAFMNRNRHRASSSHDAGLGIFKRMLEDKAESAGLPVDRDACQHWSGVPQARTYCFERRAGSYA